MFAETCCLYAQDRTVLPYHSDGENAPLTNIRARLHWVTAQYKSINDHMPRSHNSPLDSAQRERWTESRTVTYILPTLLVQSRDKK